MLTAMIRRSGHKSHENTRKVRKYAYNLIKITRELRKLRVIYYPIKN